MRINKERNYENMKKFFEKCRQELRISHKDSHGIKKIPVADDEICFGDIPENGVCVTSQFDKGLCGEIFWCRKGTDIYMLHGSIRLADHTVWLKMNGNGMGEVLHFKLLSKETLKEQPEKKEKFHGVFLSPNMSVKRFYDYFFWPEYSHGKEQEKTESNIYEIIKWIVGLIGTDFKYDLEPMPVQ